MQERKLTLPDVLYQECSITIQEGGSSVISSPFRRDSSPSFRIYFHPNEEDDNKSKIDNSYSAHDWGTGAAYNALSFLHYLHGHENWYETYEYVRQNYGIQVGKSESTYENKLPEMVRLISTSIPLTKESSPKIENAILSFLSKKELPMDQLLSQAELTI